MSHPQPRYEKSWAWKGGSSSQTYQSIAYDVHKLEKKCELCSSTNRVSVHHKDRNKSNNSRENLQILCDRCHKQLHVSEGDMLKIRGTTPKKIHDDIIFELYIQGLSSIQIARKLNYTPQGIRYRLKIMGVCLEKSDRDDISNDSIKDLYLSGKSCHEIAKLFNTSHTLIRRRLTNMGFKLRSIKDAWKNQYSRAHNENSWKRYEVTQ